MGKVTEVYFRELRKQWNVSVLRPGIILIKTFPNLPLRGSCQYCSKQRALNNVGHTVEGTTTSTICSELSYPEMYLSLH